MADITMCQDDKCLVRKKCYRFMATPDRRAQSYFSETPRKDCFCGEFWEIVPTKNRKIKNPFKQEKTK